MKKTPEQVRCFPMSFAKNTFKDPFFTKHLPVTVSVCYEKKNCLYFCQKIVFLYEKKIYFGSCFKIK